MTKMLVGLTIRLGGCTAMVSTQTVTSKIPKHRTKHICMIYNYMICTIIRKHLRKPYLLKHPMTLGPRFMQLLPQKGAFPRPNVALAKNALPTSAKTSSDHRRQQPPMSTLAIYSRDNRDYNP